MKLHEIAERINITSYPEALNNITNWDSVPDISNLQWLEEIENTYHVLGRYYPLVYKAAQELQADKNRYHWGMTVAKYLTCCTVPDARDVPMPQRNGTLIGDFLPLLILLTQLPAAVAECRRRKMSEDMIRRNFDHIVDGISIVEYRSGKPGIDLTYFRWLVKFCKCTLFNSHNFNFELRDFPGKAFVLQNKTSGELFPVLQNNRIHRSGKILNSAGCTEEDGSFRTQFIETDCSFFAHPCVNGLVSSEQREFPKEQYRLILRPGDMVLSVHIPRGTDISVRHAAESLRNGFNDAVKYYPEYDIKALYCHSWLLDPSLRKLLSPEAKIPQFGNMFARFPAISNGMEVFSFVFPHPMPFEELYENTSLQRSIKQHYLSGEHILAFSGIILPEQL